MKIRSINPATGEIIKEFESATKAEVHDSVKKARIAQKGWAKLDKKKRIEIILKLKEVLEKNKKEILSIIQNEAGYPQSDAEAIFYDVIDGFPYYIERYKKINNIEFPLNSGIQPETKAEVQFIPHGVIGNIGIWNYPFWQTMITAIPALLTGNAVVYKPSEYVSIIGLKIAECIHKAGVPKDVYIPVLGGEDVGKHIVSSDVDAIVFTGGIDTGKHITKNAGIKPLILELSGNDAAIVCGDCDLKQSVRGIVFGTFLHSGQSCIRIKRVYVVKEIAEKFITEFVEYSNKLKIGEQISPMIRDEARKNVHRVVEEAVEKGAELLLGGKIPDGKGFYYPATVLLVKDDNLEVMKKETFGPVCPIRIVKNEDEAIHIANNTDYGLGGTVWTQDFKKAKEIAEKLETGTVWVNDSNLPLVCGEYTQGMKNTSIASSQERIMMFLKKRNIISFNSNKNRDWWF
jgi:acyl-CoA reductase-like NAD-dependent aldehyde dehydrogenase